MDYGLPLSHFMKSAGILAEYPTFAGGAIGAGVGGLGGYLVGKDLKSTLAGAGIGGLGGAGILNALNYNVEDYIKTDDAEAYPYIASKLDQLNFDAAEGRVSKEDYRKKLSDIDREANLIMSYNASIQRSPFTTEMVKGYIDQANKSIKEKVRNERIR